VTGTDLLRIVAHATHKLKDFFFFLIQSRAAKFGAG
jgi:hypothetical protein